MSNEIIGFNTRMLEKMAERGMTQADLCRHTGLASSMISHYCTGQRTPSVPAALKIAKALRTTVDYLAYGDYRHAKGVANGDLIVGENETPYRKEPVLYECDVNEQAIINTYRLLSDEGQSKILSYVDDLFSAGKYQQN